MKINDIILKEEIDQKEADLVFQGLVASGDPYDKQVANEFQKTRLDPRYTSVDAAQQAAETRARNAMKAKINKLKRAEEQGKIGQDENLTRLNVWLISDEDMGNMIENIIKPDDLENTFAIIVPNLE